MLAGATLTQPKITWSTTSVSVILSPGESTSSDLTFTSSQNLTNVSLGVVTQIAPFVTVQPSSISSLAANQTQSVHLSIGIPTNAKFGTCDGTIQLKSGTTTFPQTVKIVVNVWQAFANAELGVKFKFPSSWRTSTIPNAKGESLYISDQNEEFPGEGITITKSSDSLANALGQIQLSFDLLSQQERTLNGSTWGIYVFGEPSTKQHSNSGASRAICQRNRR